MPTGTEFNVCSTTKPYQQPLAVFAQTLWPLGSQARPPQDKVHSLHGTPSAGSAHPGSVWPGHSTSCATAMEASDDTEEPPLPLALTRFQVSEEFGFLLPDPLVGAGCAPPSACHRRQRAK